MKTVVRKAGRHVRHLRLRQAIAGTSERPRLCVMVSNYHIYVQLVDDEKGVTLGTASSCGKSGIGAKTVAGAKVLGQKIAELAQAKGIQAVVFDRGGFKYHGRVKALADAAREAGLKF
jgi:large subunit ribosomal protein L18